MVRRKPNRKEIHGDIKMVYKISLTATGIRDTHYRFHIKVEGPVGAWFEIWKRAYPEGREPPPLVGWDKVQELTINPTGYNAVLVTVDRLLYTRQEAQLSGIGENEEHSNLLYLGVIEQRGVEPEEEEKPPEEVPEEIPSDATGYIRDIAEAKNYDRFISMVSAYTRVPKEQLKKEWGKPPEKPFTSEMLGKGKLPDEVFESAKDAAREADSKYKVMVAGAAALEVIPLVDLGSASLHAMSAPEWAAGNEMARNFYYSGYRYVTDPIIQQYWFSKNTPLVPEAYRLALAASKGLISDTQYEYSMSRVGYNKIWADVWKEQNYERPNYSQITSMLFRGLIDGIEYKRLMMLAGYSPEDIPNMLYSSFVIPPLSDLITMAVREAFGKHTYEEQMPALVNWGIKQGLTKEWVERYWYAHWERIPLTQMYENLWRGYWSAEEFDRMLRIKDVHPDDREAIYKVAYRVPSIREMGYGYDMQVYNREDIVRFRKWGGLSPEDAEKSADALIEYRTSAEWEAVRREFLWQYAHSQMERNDYKSWLEATHLNAELVNLWLIRGDLQRKRYEIPDMAVEYRIVTSSEALWAYKNGLRDKDWLKAKLAELTWSEERVNVAIERADHEMALKEGVEDIVAPKHLTAAQLRSLYNAKLMSIDTLALRLMTELNYAPEDAMLLAELWSEPEEVEPEVVEPRKLTLTQLKNMYESQMMDKAEFIERLQTELNYSLEDAIQLAELYTPKPEEEVEVPEEIITPPVEIPEEIIPPPTEIPVEKVIYTKPFTDAWSRRLYAQRLLMPSQVYKNYIALGYEPKQAEKLTISMLIDDMYPMLVAQYSKGQITEEQFMQELINIGMEAWQALDLLDRTIRDYQVDRLDDERKLTKTEILKGLKTGVLTESQTINLLTDIGYEEWEADYIVYLELVTAKGDPETYWDMKKVTEAYKRALNRNNKVVPDEVLMLDKELQRAKRELQELKDNEASEKVVAEKVNEVSDIEARLRKVLVLKKLY
jgi:hypothetical protein